MVYWPMVVLANMLSHFEISSPIFSLEPAQELIPDDKLKSVITMTGSTDCDVCRFRETKRSQARRADMK